MDPTWITTVLLVPCVIVLTAGFFYLYGVVIGLLSKTSVRNKVVVITDALSGLGRGNGTMLCCSTFTVLQLFLRLVFELVFKSIDAECAGVFHKGGARLILCGKSWEKLEEFADDLANASDPTVVSRTNTDTRADSGDRWRDIIMHDIFRLLKAAFYC